MANEIEIDLSLVLTGSDGTQYINWQSGSLNISQVNSGYGHTKYSQSITTGAAALDVGQLPALGYLLAYNPATETGNNMILMSSTGGISIGNIPPGGVALLPLGSSITAPAAKMLSTAKTGTFILLAA